MSDHTTGEKGAGATYIENANGHSTKRPGIGSKIGAHFRKFWLIHLIIFCATFLIITLLLVYVGLPSIAQNGVNDSHLELQDQIITDPTPDSIHMKQTGTLHNPLIFTPTLDPFRAALFLENTEPNIKPFGYLQLGSIHATKNTQIVIDQTLQITDADQFAAYTTLVMNSETFRLALRGMTRLHLGKLPSTVVDYNEVVTMKGLNKLKGFDIPNFQVLLKPAADGSNMIGQAYIPNPSVMTLTMGNVTFSLYSGDTYLGNSTLPNLVLAPGNNTVELRSKVDQSAVLKIVTGRTDGMLPIDIRGDSVVYNGLNLPYFEAALKSNPLHIELSVCKPFAALGLTQIPGCSK